MSASLITASDSDALVHHSCHTIYFMERLNKFLAHAGVASRRRCDALIAAGRERHATPFAEIAGDLIGGPPPRLERPWWQKRAA